MTMKIATMKKKLYGHILKLSFTLLVIQFTTFTILAAQDSVSTNGSTASISLKVVKNNDGARTFTSKLTGEGEKGTFPVYEAEVSYYNEADGGKVLIGKGKTNKDGIVSITVEKETKYRKDKNGVITIKSVFNGSGKITGAEASANFKDLNLTLDLSEKDSVRSILINASSVGANDEKIPLKETTVNVYIQGLFSKLKVGDCFLENGQGSFKFPDNIPGDENGKTKIFVRIEENESFADVEKIETAKWGQHRSGFIEPTRSLWSSGAPLWMIITLTILLVGVWSHYLYAIIQMVNIRKDGMIFDKKLNND